MPKKNKDKKERTIVREFIETRFKEIKSEKKEEVKEEKPQETQEEESFSDFSTSNRTPIMLKSEEVQGSLERTAENAPSIRKDGEENSADLYSTKKYEANNEKYTTMEISSSPLSTSRTNEVRDLFSRRNPQTQFQDRFAENWQNNNRNNNEERQYESIEMKSKEEDRVRLENRKRMMRR